MSVADYEKVHKKTSNSVFAQEQLRGVLEQMC